MQQSFDESYKDIADSMGITVYQRFNLSEASLFLRCHTKELNQIIQQEKIDFIQLTEDKVEFFGYQLLAYLLNNVIKNSTNPKTFDAPDKIIRSKEVQELVGLSRTTIWRMERTGEFPNRVSLGTGSVGWKLNELLKWIQDKS